MKSCEKKIVEGEMIRHISIEARRYALCEECNGRRFKDEVLDVKYKGKNIFDVLELSIEEAMDFFQKEKSIYEKIKPLRDVGLGYVKLGQSSSSLSGGEAQRVKLATELSKKDTGKTFYILDEPTTGLHFQDIRMLLNVLNKLVDKGNTVLIVEHNLDVIKVADYIIDLGLEGGDNGGHIVVSGNPEQVIKSKKSYTAAYLKEALKKRKSAVSGQHSLQPKH